MKMFMHLNLSSSFFDNVDSVNRKTIRPTCEDIERRFIHIGLFDSHCKREASNRSDVYGFNVNDVDSLTDFSSSLKPYIQLRPLPIHLRRSKGISWKSTSAP